MMRLCVREFDPPPADIDIIDPRPPLPKLIADEFGIEMPLPPPPMPEQEFCSGEGVKAGEADIIVPNPLTDVVAD